MTVPPPPENVEVLRRASLEGLRAEAQDELGSVVTERLHGGEDPWAFMDELPTIDELVVLLLRADLFDAEGGRKPGSDYARDRRMLGDIREAHPGLSATIDGMLERLDRLRWRAGDHASGDPVARSRAGGASADE